MRNLIILFFWLFLTPSFLTANPGDSLKNVLAEADNDFQRVSALTDLINYYARIDFNEVLPYSKQVVALAKTMDSDSLLGTNFLTLGSVYANLGKPDTALIYFDKSMKTFEKGGLKSGIADAYFRNVWVYTNAKVDLDLALENAFKALEIYEETGSKGGMSAAYCSIADIFQKQHNIEESDEWVNKALELVEETGDKRTKNYAMSITATNFKLKKEFEKAVEAYDQIIKMDEADNNLPNLCMTYSNKADVLEMMGKVNKTLECLEKSYFYCEKSNFTNVLPALSINIGDIYYDKKNYTGAIENYSKAIELSEKFGQTKDVAGMYEGLFKSHRALGNYKKALDFHVAYSAVMDSTFNEDKERVMNELTTKYKTEQKEQEIALLSEQKKVQAAEITAARNRNFLLLGLLGILLLGGGVFYYRRQLNEQLRLQSIRSQISSDLHDEVGSSLAQLSMIMGSVEGSDPASAKSYLQKGNEILSSSISKIRDVVWAIDAKNDDTGALLDRMEDFAYDMLSAKNIKYEILNEGFDRNAALPPLIRQNFYLFFKEAITNIHKHSDATKVQIDFSKKGKNLSLKIADNGKDLNDKKVSGSGIENMKLRAKKIGGTFDFEKNETGFSVSLNASMG